MFRDWGLRFRDNLRFSVWDNSDLALKKEFKSSDLRLRTS